MDESIKVRVDRLIEAFNAIKNAYRWSSDVLSRSFAALTYTLSDREFDIVKFKDVQQFMTDNTKLFSHYRSHERFTIPSLLITKFEDPKEAFLNLLMYEDKLKNAGFTKSPMLAIAAYSLLLTCPSERIDKQAARAMDIYKRMKEKHFWLTGHDDYPLATLISSSEKEPDLLIDEIESYYSMLNEGGLSKSNGLQQLSHILTFSSENAQSKCKRCAYILDYFKEHKIHVYTRNYGLLGLIALIGDGGLQMPGEIEEIYEYLNNEKAFKWVTKEVKLLMSCALVCDMHIKNIKENKGILEASVGISIEALIAAQNAAVIAAVAASSAAASASASS